MVKNPNLFHRGLILQASFSPGNFPGWIHPGYRGRVYSLIISLKSCNIQLNVPYQSARFEFSNIQTQNSSKNLNSTNILSAVILISFSITNSKKFYNKRLLFINQLKLRYIYQNFPHSFFNFGSKFRTNPK